jgi:hypothetical protein
MPTRLTRLSAAVVAVAGFLFLAPRASADNVDSLDLTYKGGGNGVNGGGPFHWTQKTPVNTNFNTTLTTYCIDISDGIRSGTFTTHTDLTLAPTIGNDSTKVAAINTLYDHFYSSSFASSTTEAAFQLALWKLVYGSSLTIDTSTTTGKEANWLLNGKSYDGTTYNGSEHDLANAQLVALVASDNTKPRNQDQLLVVPNPTVKGVPTPPALMLAGVGVLALAGRARWIRRTKPTA